MAVIADHGRLVALTARRLLASIRADAGAARASLAQDSRLCARHPTSLCAPQTAARSEHPICVE